WCTRIYTIRTLQHLLRRPTSSSAAATPRFGNIAVHRPGGPRATRLLDSEFPGVHTGRMRPVTRYAKSGKLSIAYQVVGEGPLDLVLVHGFVSHLDVAWEEPHLAQFLNRLASFSRLIVFDKRGTGLSDPVAEPPTFAERMDDVRAVMDAAGSERAALFGISEGGPLSIVFSCTHATRTSALVVYGSYARWLPDRDYPWGRSQEQFRDFLAGIDRP